MLFLISLFVTIVPNKAIHITWDNTIPDDNFQENLKAEEARMPNWFLIFPGTKWCGAGNIAENDDDLGEYRHTDKCCRSHDMCDDYIMGYDTKYNLTNPSFYTRLNCKCDEEFRSCLKTVGSRVSKQVGQIYFTALGTQCFRMDYPIVGCKTYTYVPSKKCAEYEYDTSQEKVYQWFDVANF